ncbi:hypothetical protein OG874_20955 [Nocardia sp. NBC_00565]|uniref:hypothetical protein n=1 Tax=Nocardia sp. NBC_00565 TaxID=2975993 RepID=UPI002E803186|nr:hypothetical protein [Nocardia sp. NBC_00565]WUC07405.1 hypothetical protein OG874_20955 [Nocardia sp. NBC_00565]
MSTAISDISTDLQADVDLGFESVPRIRRPRRGGVRALDAARAASDRRPRDGRPGGAVVLSDHGPVRAHGLRQAQGPHPMARVERAQVGFAVLAVAALLSALVVTALIGLAHWRAGTFGGETSPSVPAVVEQQSIPDGAGIGVPQ